MGEKIKFEDIVIIATITILIFLAGFYTNAHYEKTTYLEKGAAYAREICLQKPNSVMYDANHVKSLHEQNMIEARISIEDHEIDANRICSSDNPLDFCRHRSESK